MLKTGVKSSRVHQVGETELLYSAQSLKIGMLNKIIYNAVWDIDKPIYRIVDDFSFIQFLATLIVCCIKNKKNTLIKYL